MAKHPVHSPEGEINPHYEEIDEQTRELQTNSHYKDLEGTSTEHTKPNKVPSDHQHSQKTYENQPGNVYENQREQVYENQLEDGMYHNQFRDKL